MKFLILSDIHLEFHRDGGREFLASLPATTGSDEAVIDGVILAGDICALSQLSWVLQWFGDHYSHVVYLWGNHECWSHSIGAVREVALMLQGKLANVHVLDNSRIEIATGAVFLGGCLWFGDQKDNEKFELLMNDFDMIENLNNEVYQENQKTVEYLQQNVRRGDVVVTHHMPSSLSVASEYEGSELNRFFLCDMEETMAQRQPKLWVHGHTHSSFDYTIFATRVVCNPLGYPFEPNPGWYPMVIDV